MAIVPLLIKDGIFAVVQSNQAKLRALGVKRLGLFGSFVRGEQKPDSDVDFLVEFEPDTKTFKNFMGCGTCLKKCCVAKSIWAHLNRSVPTSGLEYCRR